MKKVLIITYYWPPAGGISVQRVVKFCKYLSEFNWQPVILTVNNGSYLHLDDSYQKDIKNIQTIYRADTLEPHQIYNKIKTTKPLTKQRKPRTSKISRIFDWFADFVRLNLFIPDARIGWYPKAVMLGRKIIKEEKPDLIFSTAPPFTCHMVAKKLQTETRLPWIADFRDAWLENNLYEKPYRLLPARLLNKRFEKSVLNNASQVVCIGENMKQLMASKIPPQERNKFHVIMNGYDFEDVALNAKTSDNFYISYFGTFYKDRLPYNLLSAMKIAIRKDKSLKENLRFRIFGNIDDNCLDVIRNYLPEENLILNKPVAYTEFMQQVQIPQLLLLTIDKVPHNELIVTGKIFDYMTSGNPVIGIGPTEGDAALLLRETQVGKMFDYEDNKIADYICEKYLYWQQGKLKHEVNQFKKLERKQLTGELARLFDTTMSTD